MRCELLVVDRLALTYCEQSDEYLTQTRKQTSRILRGVFEHHPVSRGGEERINGRTVRHLVQPAVRKYFVGCVTTFLYILKTEWQSGVWLSLSEYACFIRK